MSTCNRREAVRSYPIANGTIVTVILRDSLVPEDPYLTQARAKALAVKRGTEVKVEPTSRRIKDILIKTNITI